jgi:hypothetical protein
MLKRIKPREIRLLSAVSALALFVISTSTPTGMGADCCKDETAKYNVTFVNNHKENDFTEPFLGTSLGAPNVVALVFDPRKNSPNVKGLQYTTVPLKVGETKTISLEKSVAYYYSVFELAYEYKYLLDYKLGTKKPATTKLVQTGSIIDDATIVIE